MVALDATTIENEDDLVLGADPADDQQDGEQAAEQAEPGNQDEQAPPEETEPAAPPTPDKTVAVPLAAPGQVPTDEAQAAFDKRKHDLEESLGKLAIEGAQLKAATKANREAFDDCTGSYRNHLLRGPVRLPLFDSAAAAGAAVAKARGDGEQPAGEDSTAPADPPQSPADSGSEAWRLDRLDTCLPDLTGKILEVLADHGIKTMGDLAEVVVVTGSELSQLKGMTEKRLTKVEAAVDAYWTERKEQALLAEQGQAGGIAPCQR